MSGENTLLGFLTPDMPLNDFTPTTETLSILELFANQAAVVIVALLVYEEARRTGEERAALVEIARRFPHQRHSVISKQSIRPSMNRYGV